MAVILVISLFATAAGDATAFKHEQKKEQTPARIPVVQPKAASPKIAQVQDKVPVLEPKSEKVPVVELKSEKVPVVEPKSVIQPVQTQKESVDSTYEAYRQAMLHSGPRQMEEESRAEMQNKAGHSSLSQWRDQTAALRKQLDSEDAGEFLERANMSVNDRMVAIFDSVKA